MLGHSQHYQWKTEFLFLVPFVYNPFILKIRHKHFCLVFLQGMVDLIKLSHMHTRGSSAQQHVSSVPLCHMNSDLTGQWASCTYIIFMTFFDLKARTKLNTFYPLE